MIATSCSSTTRRSSGGTRIQILRTGAKDQIINGVLVIEMALLRGRSPENVEESRHGALTRKANFGGWLNCGSDAPRETSSDTSGNACVVAFVNRRGATLSVAKDAPSAAFSGLYRNVAEYDLASKNSGGTYRVQVFTPSGSLPKGSSEAPAARRPGPGDRRGRRDRRGAGPRQTPGGDQRRVRLSSGAHIFEGENHLSVAPATATRALTFSF